MPHFELKDKTRFFIKDTSGDESIPVHTGNKVALQQWGGADQTGKVMPQLYLATPNPASANILDLKTTGIIQSFTLHGKSTGTTVLNGKNLEGYDCVFRLQVVVGEYKSYDNWKVDLLASTLGRSSDGAKIYALQRLLHNNDDARYNQKSEANVSKYGGSMLACGSVCSDVSKSLFGTVSEEWQAYHKPLKKLEKREDLEYDQTTMQRAVAAIRKHLGEGRPVRVGCTHHFETSMLAKVNGIVQPNRSGGHFVVIVGCNDTGDQFLYVDPWKTGSKLKYTGGIAGSLPMPECLHLGLFTLRSEARGPVLRQDKKSEFGFTGASALEVVIGPL